MELRVHIDFETRSEVSPQEVGAWTYSRHPDTSILCVAFAVNDGPIKLLKADNYGVNEIATNTELKALAANPHAIFVAHNAFFEQCIWENIMVTQWGYPPIVIVRWRCTAAKAAYFSLPRSLEEAAKALGLPIQKDKEGYLAMVKLCKPRKSSQKNKHEDYFWETDTAPLDFEKLYKYCPVDVEVERLIDKALPDLNVREQEVWFLDQTINRRGIQMDVATVQVALEYMRKTTEELLEEFRDITLWCVDKPSQRSKFLNWLHINGCDIPDLQAATISQFIEKAENYPPECIRALTIRKTLSMISTAKYTSMLYRTDAIDFRLRDILLYAAAITGRWGGRGVQLQNLPRGTVNSDTAIFHMLMGDWDWFKQCYPNQMPVYSSCIRGMLVAKPGHELIVSDFSSIEARVLPWLAGQESILETFREGKDIYCQEAENIYDRPISKKDKYERSVGKVAVLALGYGGGIGAFGTMARAYSVDLAPAYALLWSRASTEEQEKARLSYEYYLKRVPEPMDRASGYAADIIKQRWRAANPHIVQWWKDLEAGAKEAVLSGEKITIGGSGLIPTITYGMFGTSMLCKLPSGNCIVYPQAAVRLDLVETPWGGKEKKPALSYKTQSTTTYQWNRISTYGGKLAENITQAVARDLLADAMVRVERSGYPIVLHVHDEIVSEVPEGFGSVRQHEELMATPPLWAEGLPIGAEGWRGKRYKK